MNKLAAALIGGGVAIGMALPEVFSVGGWFTGAVLLVFAAVMWRTFVTNRSRNNSPRSPW